VTPAREDAKRGNLSISPVQACSNNNKTEIRPLNYAVVTRTEYNDVKREWKMETTADRKGARRTWARMRGKVRRLSHNLLRPFRLLVNAPEDTRDLTSFLTHSHAPFKFQAYRNV